MIWLACSFYYMDKVTSYIKECETEFMQLLGLTCFPAYEIAYKEISLLVSDEQGYDSLGSAHYDYRTGKHELIGHVNFPADFKTLKDTMGVIFNYFGRRSICKMYSKDYQDNADTSTIEKILTHAMCDFLKTYLIGVLTNQQIAVLGKFYKVNQTALSKMKELFIQELDEYKAGVEDALYKRDSSITGMGFSIWSSSFVNHAIYAAMEASTLNKQEAAANKGYQREIDALHRSIISKHDGAKKTYIDSTYIQRFGRVDRIGSTNACIQLVNFWPNLTLDEYINLKSRVETRMKITVMTSTGDDDLINSEEKGDLEYRRQQLKRLQDEVVDLEDMGSGISILDLGLNEFRLDLLEYTKTHGDLSNKPKGLHAVVPATPELPQGVIFVLRNVNDGVNIDNQNRIHPFYMVYVDMDGNVVCDYLNPKRLLDDIRLLCRGRSKPIRELCQIFNRETDDGRDMEEFSLLLNDAIAELLLDTT